MSSTRINNEQGFAPIAVVLVVAVLAAISFGGYRYITSNNKQTTVSPSPGTTNNIPAEENKEEEFASYTHKADLEDVTNGATLESVVFNGKSNGAAFATFEDGTFKLYASITNLPVLPDHLFYEGWVVGGAEGIVSTGELVSADELYVNNYTSTKDLTDSARYVLTIEPRDDNPAPAPGHVVEGDFVVN